MAETTGAPPAQLLSLALAESAVSLHTCRRRTIVGSGLAIYSDNQEPSFWSPQRRDETQILCALAGARWEARVRGADGTEFALPDGENRICVLPPGAIYSLLWKSAAGLIVLRVTSEWMQREALTVPAFVTIDSFTSYTLGDSFIGALLVKFHEPCRSPLAQSEAQVLALGNLLALEVLRAKAQQATRAAGARATETILGPETKARVFAFIENRLTGPITIPELANEARLSVSHFSTIFKATTGLTPEHYILQRRLWLARRLIETGTRTVGEVAHATGFADHSHLTVQFKRLFGAPPKAYLPAVRYV